MTDDEGLDELLRRVDMQNARRAAGQTESIQDSSNEEFDQPSGWRRSADESIIVGDATGRIQRALNAIKALGRGTA